MKTQSVIPTNCNNAMRQGNAERIEVIIMTREGHAAMHERVQGVSANDKM